MIPANQINYHVESCCFLPETVWSFGSLSSLSLAWGNMYCRGFPFIWGTQICMSSKDKPTSIVSIIVDSWKRNKQTHLFHPGKYHNFTTQTPLTFQDIYQTAKSFCGGMNVCFHKAKFILNMALVPIFIFLWLEGAQSSVASLNVNPSLKQCSGE